MNRVEYRVLGMNPETGLLKIARSDLSQSLCALEFTNTTLNSEVFEYAAGTGHINLTLLYCCPELHLPVPFRFVCPVEGMAERNGYTVPGTKLISGECGARVVMPVSYVSFLNVKDLKDMVREGFEVTVKDVESGACLKCERSSGRCGYDDAAARNEFVCFCSGRSAAGPKSCAAGMEAAAGNYSTRAASASAPVQPAT